MPAPADFVPGIPEAINSIVKKATGKNPRDRYASAEDMRQDIAWCLTSPGRVRAKEGMARSKKQEKPKRTNAALKIALLSIVVLGV
jgi:serine/threonine-protein kinase